MIRTSETGAVVSSGNYAQLGDDRNPVHVWYDPEDASIHLTCRDPRLTDEHGGKPVFRVVFNANPASADYHPRNFNRLARFLRQEGKSAPDEVPVHPRHLALRPQVVANLAVD